MDLELPSDVQILQDTIRKFVDRELIPIEMWAREGADLKPAVRAALQAKGIMLLRWDLGQSDLDGLPRGFTHVFHSAVIKNVDDFNSQVDRHAFATAQLMTHCRDAEAFLFISASSVLFRMHLSASASIVPPT